MNNSAEAEKIKTPEEYFAPLMVVRKMWSIHDLIKMAGEYHVYAREKELSALTDEVIEGIIKIPPQYNEKSDGVRIMFENQRRGAKALLDYLKQNNESKSLEG